MNRIHKSLASISVVALALAALAPMASARGLGGYGGHADNGAQTSSFSENWNAVVYNGSGSARWDIPLLIDGLGTLSPTAYVYVSGVSSNVSCSTQSVSQNQGTIYNTKWVSPTTGNSWSSVAPGGVTGITNGSLEIGCFIGTGSKIQTITW